MNKYITVLFSLIFILPAFCLDNPEVLSDIQWEIGGIQIELTFNVNGDMTPKTKFEAEQFAEENISEIFLDSIMDFTVDSFFTINDLIENDQNLLISLNIISENGERGPAYYSTDLSKIIISYDFPIFGNGGLINPFIKHERAFPLKHVFGFSPTEQFTGIIIYAMGKYSKIGPSEEAFIKPALFPKIYDENMNIVLEKDMCNPDSLREWGMTAYTKSIDLEQYEYRIGSNPLKIMAKMVYGVKHTDIVISKLNASQILSDDNNRNLLVNGNILIIYEDF